MLSITQNYSLQSWLLNSPSISPYQTHHHQTPHQQQEQISFGYEEQVDEPLSDFESGETEQGKINIDDYARLKRS